MKKLIIGWVVEAGKRLLSKNPVWYKPLNIILASLTGIGATLNYLVAQNVDFGKLTPYIGTAAIYIPIAIGFGAKFAMKDLPVITNEDNLLLPPTTDPAIKPYTALIEQKKIEANSVVSLGKAGAEAAH